MVYSFVSLLASRFSFNFHQINISAYPLNKSDYVETSVTNTTSFIPQVRPNGILPH